MSNEFIIFLFAIGVLAIAAHAYNVGWQNGHDVHHNDDDYSRGDKPPTPPTPPRQLYV